MAQGHRQDPGIPTFNPRPWTICSGPLALQSPGVQGSNPTAGADEGVNRSPKPPVKELTSLNPQKLDPGICQTRKQALSVTAIGWALTMSLVGRKLKENLPAEFTSTPNRSIFIPRVW